jgi:hypothetical protein
MSRRAPRALGALIPGLGAADTMNIRPVSLALLVGFAIALAVFLAARAVASLGRRRTGDDAETGSGN